MKHFTASIVLPWLAVGMPGQLSVRQNLAVNPFTAPKQKAFKVEKMQPLTGVPGAVRIKLIYGPYRLTPANSTKQLGNAKSMDKGGTSYQYAVDSDFPADVTVLQSKSEVQAKDFKRATTDAGIYNHHNVFADILKPPRLAFGCAGRAVKQVVPVSIFTAGATENLTFDFRATKGDVKAGYYIAKNRIMFNALDVINYKNEEQIVYTATEIEYLPGKPDGYIDSSQQLVDPGLCGGAGGTGIHAPVGVKKFTINTTDIIMNESGYIINARGHMHDGGVNILLKINDKEVCNSKAMYGGEGFTTKTNDGKVWETIRETTYCQDPVKVKKGDKVYFEANYDTELHPSREMGGGHGGMMKPMKRSFYEGHGLTKRDGDAEQMALMVTYFAATKD